MLLCFHNVMSKDVMGYTIIAKLPFIIYHIAYKKSTVDWLSKMQLAPKNCDFILISTFLRDIVPVFFSDILWIIKRALRLHKAFTRIDRKSDNSVTGRKNCILNFEVWTWTWTWFEWVSWRARQWGMLTNLHNYQHGKIWLSFAVHGNLLPDSTEWGVSLEFHHRRLRTFSIFFFDYREKNR